MERFFFQNAFGPKENLNIFISNIVDVEWIKNKIYSDDIICVSEDDLG